MEYQIRKAKQSDLAALADVEACCFPVSEAASKEAIQKRLETFGDCFFVAEMPHGEVIGFINGCVTAVSYTHLCTLLARGALISMFVVILILPAMFMIFDKVICKTSARCV